MINFFGSSVWDKARRYWEHIENLGNMIRNTTIRIFYTNSHLIGTIMVVALEGRKLLNHVWLAN